MPLFAAASVIFAMVAALLAGNGCGRGFFPEVTATASTATATPVSGAFLYSTNFTDGTVSAFKRNTNTGALSFIAKQSAGPASGPEGIAVRPQNDFVYVANANTSDNNIYEFSIQQTGATIGNLTSVGGSIGSDAMPQLVAIDSTGSFVYVTNAGGQSVTEYTVNSSTGALTFLDRLSGFTGQPFGIVTHPSAALAYVADNTAGLIYAFSITSSGLSQIGGAVSSNGGVGGRPGEMAIAIDSTAEYLLVDDTVSGIVSVFVIQSDGTLSFPPSSFGTGQSKPIGIGVVNGNANTTTDFVLTANMTGNFVQPFIRVGATLTQQASIADSTGPTGLAIDPQGLFAYTGNSGNATIGLIGIQSSQCAGGGTCLIKSYASEGAGTQFVATTH